MAINVNAIGIMDGVDQFVVTQQVDPPSLLADASATQSVSLDSVGIGDAIQVVAPYDGQQVIITCAPSGEGTADINYHNVNASTVNLAPGRFTFIITRA